MYSDILSLIQTTQDINTLKHELSVLKSSQFDQKNSFDTVIRTKVRDSVADILINSIQSNGLSASKYADGLLAELDTFEVVNLTLAYEPSAEDFAAIYQWIQDTIGTRTALDVYLNPNILGGAQVSFRGKYYDGSLISKVNKTIQNISKNGEKI